MSDVETRRIQVRVSMELGDQIEELAEHLGTPESALSAMLLAVGLAHFRDSLPSYPRVWVERWEREQRDLMEHEVERRLAERLAHQMGVARVAVDGVQAT